MSAPGQPDATPSPCLIERRAPAIALLLALATAAVFGRATGGGFVELDDQVYVVENPQLALGFTPAGLQWLASTVVLNTWHPLTMASHMLDVTLYGLDRPAGHHLTSVLLHAANTALAFWVLGRLSGAWGASLATALLWGWHPLRVESVAWIAERKDVLCGLFFFLTLAAYARYARRPTSAGYVGVLLLLGLGLLAKPMLVTVPCVLLLLDYWPLRRWQPGGQAGAKLGELISEKLPLIFLVAAFSLVTLRTQEKVVEGSSQPWAQRAGHILLAYGDYLWQAVWPAGLAAYYPRWPASERPTALATSAVVLLVVSLALVWQARRRPGLLVGWLWFLGMLVPVVGFVQVGSQARADRYTYLPAVGLTWAVVLWVQSWPRPAWPAKTLITAIVAGILAVLTWQQISFWRDSETLFRRALAVTQRNVVMEEALALVLVEKGEVDEALAHLDRALEIQPTYARALYDKGYLFHRLGRWDQSVAAYGEAIGLGYRGLQIRVDYGRVLADRGDFVAAAEQFDAALALAPRQAEALLGLGDCETGRGRDGLALERYRQALTSRPGWSVAIERLAWLLAVSPLDRVRRPEEALALATALVSARGDDPEALDTLAAAQAARGDFASARQTAEQALALAQRPLAPGALVTRRHATPEALAERLRLYRAGRAFRCQSP